MADDSHTYRLPVPEEHLEPFLELAVKRMKCLELDKEWHPAPEVKLALNKVEESVMQLARDEAVCRVSSLVTTQQHKTGRELLSLQCCLPDLPLFTCFHSFKSSYRIQHGFRYTIWTT